MGRTVERPVKPISIELSQNEVELRDPRAYPVKVCYPDVRDALIYEHALNSGASKTT